MNKFKINEKIKTDLCRQVKEIVNQDLINKDYIELVIMYNTNDDKFEIHNTFDIDKLEYKEYCAYKTLQFYKTDGKVTIKELKEKIFPTRF